MWKNPWKSQGFFTCETAYHHPVTNRLDNAVMREALTLANKVLRNCETPKGKSKEDNEIKETKRNLVKLCGQSF